MLQARKPPIRTMRINLQCPFQDKDIARQRGARWDPRLRVWYVQDVADLGQFAAWLPQPAGTATAAPVAQRRAAPAPSAGTQRADKAAVITQPVVPGKPDCACAVLPWEDCDCTRAAAASRP